ncbi:MAG: O-antigen ligase [Planctomycetota bacterium]
MKSLVPTHRPIAWMALFIIPGMFFLVEHRWDASSYYVNTATDSVTYDGSENGTADRQKTFNIGSTAARMMLAMAGIAGLILPSSKRMDTQSPLFWCLFLFAVWTFATYFWSVDSSQTAFKLCVLVVFTVSSLGFSRALVTEELTWVIGGSCLIYLVLGLVAELAQGTFEPLGDYRFTGTQHPNTQAAYGAILSLVCGSFLLSTRSRISMLILFFVAVCFVALTKSRTTVAAVLFGLTALQLVRVKGANRILWAAGALFTVAAGGFLISTLGSAVRARLGTAAALGRADEVNSLTGRIPLWNELLDAIQEHPICGHGYLAYWSSEQVEYLSDLFAWEIPHGHNMYLDVLLDSGIIGLALFVAVIMSALLVAIRQHNMSRSPQQAFIVAFLCYAIFHGLGESFFKLPGSPNFMLLTLVLSMLWRNEQTIPTSSCRRIAKTPVLRATPVLIQIRKLRSSYSARLGCEEGNQR